MTPRYSVTASCGLTVMRRDFATITEAVLWRKQMQADGWKTSEPTLIDTPTAASTATAPLRGAT